MKKYQVGKPLRLLFILMATIIWLGIWLTGFGVTHWLLYVPATFIAVAGITGICPTLILNKMLLREE